MAPDPPPPAHRVGTFPRCFGGFAGGRLPRRPFTLASPAAAYYKRRMPDLSLERALGGRVAGIDEAGRGPWAGPVVAAAVVLNVRRLPRTLRDGIDDSKRVTPARRVALFAALAENAAIGVGQAAVDEIDSINILQASMLAMTRAIAALCATGVKPDRAIVDGNRAPLLSCPAQCVIGGDARSLSIAAASIVAKVTRDRLMADLARMCPGYGWERNFGYGTGEHLAALEELGATPHHRRSFAPVIKILEMYGGFGHMLRCPPSGIRP